MERRHEARVFFNANDRARVSAQEGARQGAGAGADFYCDGIIEVGDAPNDAIYAAIRRTKTIKTSMYL